MQKSQSQTQVEDNKKEWRPFWILSIIIVGFIFSFNHLLSFFTGLATPSGVGEFGDQFGVLNTLFTGLAFAGLIVTILLQSDQLKMQNKEFLRQKNMEPYKFLILKYLVTLTE